MGTDHRVFFAEPTGAARRWLGCYDALAQEERCAVCPGGYHQKSALVGDFPAEIVFGPDGRPRHYRRRDEGDYGGDRRWPAAAECGFPFAPGAAHRQVFERALYRRAQPEGELALGPGEAFTLDDAPAGACWDAWWSSRKGPDGRALAVRLPDGRDWYVDSRCSNCTRPEDYGHRCWVRHGRPEDGTLHVDKDGDTCGAGAGSIVTKKYHGFLHRGVLTPC